jgi:hypothetical protein
VSNREQQPPVRTPEEDKRLDDALASVHRRFGRAMRRLSE